jgi:iron complex outermembrane recepter protein
MKALSFSLLLCFCLSQDTFSQISGKLTTAGGGPLPMANVLLLKSTDTSLVKASLTDEKGVFQIENARQGKYILRCSSVGFQTWESPVFELTDTGKNKDFGTQIMKEEPKTLGEVIVRHEKPLFQQQIDGIVVNVASSVLAKGSSALEVLERSPGVLIDRRENSIDLNGKSGVMVMINGKLMRIPMGQVISLLNGMSADDIEKIELLTTPPAKYDAEGSAGMINIVLKKTKKKGTNGSFSVTGGYGRGEKATGSVNLTHNTKNVDIYGSYTYSHDRSYNDFNVTSTQIFPLLGGPMRAGFWNTTKPIENDHNATLGIDAKIKPGTTIGSSVTFNNSRVSSTVYNRADYDILPDSLLLFNGVINNLNRWTNLISNIYLEKEIRKGEKINYDIDYLYYNNDNPTNVLSSFVSSNGNMPVTTDSLYASRQRGFAHTTIQVGVGKLDYSKQLSEKTKLETGLKGTYTGSTSLSGIESLVNDKWVSEYGTTNDIVMKEGIGAVYASVTSQIDPLTSLVIGTRYEYSRTRMKNAVTGKDTIDRKLGVLFPNISLSRKLGDNMELQLSYSKRISRPTYNDLASFISYNDPISVFTGNPLLKPTITNNLKLGMNYRDFSFSVLLSKDDYPIIQSQLTKSPSGNILYISPQNLTSQRNLTFQTSLPWKVASWLTMNYGFVGGWKSFKEDYTFQPVDKTYFSYSVNFSESFRLPKNFLVELSGWYNSMSYYGTIKVGGSGTVNGGIKKELKGNGGDLQLSVSDIFRTMKFDNYFGTLTQEAFNVQSHVMINTESSHSQIIKLTYTRPLGSSTAKRLRNQEIGSQDEIDRVRK